MLLLAAAAAGTGLLLAQTTAPDVQVLDGTTVINLNDTDAFPSTPVGTANSKTFTVTNTGNANLLVSEAISVPQGFTLMASFPGVPDTTLPTNVPAFTILPGASATFTVALNSATAGTFSGNVSFQTNVTGKNPFVFTVTGTVLPLPSLRYIDADLSPGFTATPGFDSGATQNGTATGTPPFQGAATACIAVNTLGNPTETATFSFTGLEPGQYKVAATWVGYTTAATNTPYTICDGTTALNTVRVDQTADAAGFNDAGSTWQDFGTYTITGTTLAVKVTNDATNPAVPANSVGVVADAVRIERVGYPGQIIDADRSPTGFTATPGFDYGATQNGTATGTPPFQGAATACIAVNTLGNPTQTATFSFTGLTAGQYRVSATWVGYTTGATNTPYTVYNGATALGTVRVDQTADAAGFNDAGSNWQDLGIYTITGTTLAVKVTNDATNPAVPANSVGVVADAVRIERVNTPTSPSQADTVRFLEQATWGPTGALVDQLAGGVAFSTWLDQQYATAATSYPSLPLYSTNDNITNPINTTTSCPALNLDGTANAAFRTACLRDHYSMYPLQNQFFLNAFYGDDQLRQRVAWALHKIWVISGADITQSAWVARYLQILSTDASGHGAFGNYRTLMYDVTLNAGMGKYLDMAGSTKTAPNENYPRELLQLFTIGLYELNPDGSQKMDNQSPPQPIATYDQALINNITKVFTGWNLAPAVSSGVPNYIDPMRLNGAATENPTNHDFTSKNLLRGFVQPARTSSVANAYLDLNEALDNIYSHPSLAPFICKQLIQQLVTSNPSPAYVARVADVFNRNKTASNQMYLVVKAILLDPEARGDRKLATNYGHLKEPVLYINNLMRMWNPLSDNLTQGSDGYLNPKVVTMGQDVFRPPSVFSYFSPSKVAVGGNPPVIGPEFQIQTTSTVLARANFINTAVTPNSTRTIDVVQAHGTTPSGTDPNTGLPLVPTGPLGTGLDFTDLLPYTTDDLVPYLVSILNQYMMHSTMTAEMQADITTAVKAVAVSNPPTANQQRKRVHTALYLVATSSQYQVQQ
jgi:uncharacterized protein (DUF1800 family)